MYLIYRLIVPQREQIQMLLEQVRLPHLIPVFEKHKINYLAFLRLNESHLRDMGIEDVGDRLKILESIRMAHNNSQNSTLPSIYLQANITYVLTHYFKF